MKHRMLFVLSFIFSLTTGAKAQDITIKCSGPDTTLSLTHSESGDAYLRLQNRGVNSIFSIENEDVGAKLATLAEVIDFNNKVITAVGLKLDAQGRASKDIQFIAVPSTFNISKDRAHFKFRGTVSGFLSELNHQDSVSLRCSNI